MLIFCMKYKLLKLIDRFKWNSINNLFRVLHYLLNFVKSKFFPLLDDFGLDTVLCLTCDQLLGEKLKAPFMCACDSDISHKARAKNLKKSWELIPSTAWQIEPSTIDNDSEFSIIQN